MNWIGLRRFLETIEEDVPANNVGMGNIDGLGVGVKGEPGGYRNILKRYKRRGSATNAKGKGSHVHK